MDCLMNLFLCWQSNQKTSTVQSIQSEAVPTKREHVCQIFERLLPLLLLLLNYYYLYYYYYYYYYYYLYYREFLLKHFPPLRDSAHFSTPPGLRSPRLGIMARRPGPYGKGKPEPRGHILRVCPHCGETLSDFDEESDSSNPSDDGYKGKGMATRARDSRGKGSTYGKGLADGTDGTDGKGTYGKGKVGEGTYGKGTDGGTDGKGTYGKGKDGKVGESTYGQGTDGKGTDGKGTDGKGKDGKVGEGTYGKGYGKGEEASSSTAVAPRWGRPLQRQMELEHGYGPY